ncbi:hypothetical protein ACOME3_006540 [Neoechinorhynchus agilis]
MENCKDSIDRHSRHDGGKQDQAEKRRESRKREDPVNRKRYEDLDVGSNDDAGRSKRKDHRRRHCERHRDSTSVEKRRSSECSPHSKRRSGRSKRSRSRQRRRSSSREERRARRYRHESAERIQQSSSPHQCRHRSPEVSRHRRRRRRRSSTGESLSARRGTRRSRSLTDDRSQSQQQIRCFIRERRHLEGPVLRTFTSTMRADDKVSFLFKFIAQSLDQDDFDLSYNRAPRSDLAPGLRGPLPGAPRDDREPEEQIDVVFAKTRNQTMSQAKLVPSSSSFKGWAHFDVVRRNVAKATSASRLAPSSRSKDKSSKSEVSDVVKKLQALSSGGTGQQGTSHRKRSMSPTRKRKQRSPSPRRHRKRRRSTTSSSSTTSNTTSSSSDTSSSSNTDSSASSSRSSSKVTTSSTASSSSSSRKRVPRRKRHR